MRTFRKYRNIPTAGRRSRLEARYEHELKLRVKAGELVSYRYELPLKLIVNDILVCTYKVDWVLEYPDGHLQYVETKGFETDLWRFKWRLTKALHPDWDMLIVKDKDVR
jgi:hypothetical protein